jgi:hypothetical protein
MTESLVPSAGARREVVTYSGKVRVMAEYVYHL